MEHVLFPYQLLEMGPLELIVYKIRRRWLKSRANVIYRLVSREHCYSAAKSYLEDLLVTPYAAKDMHSVIIKNAYEGFNPDPVVSYFHDAKCIVIDRDPRDILVC